MLSDFAASIPQWGKNDLAAQSYYKWIWRFGSNCFQNFVSNTAELIAQPLHGHILKKDALPRKEKNIHIRH